MKIGIIMGSISDIEVGKKVTGVLDEFEVDYDMKVISAHRTPMKAIEYASSAEENKVEVIIAIAGKAAHLGGVLAAVTPVPVIGLPVKSSTMDGIDSLLSTVQMPKGVPVATVAINGGENAALLAIQMLSIKYETLREKFRDYKNQLIDEVEKMNEELNN